MGRAMHGGTGATAMYQIHATLLPRRVSFELCAYRRTATYADD